MDTIEMHLINTDSGLFDITSEPVWLPNIGILRISERPGKLAKVTLYAPWLFVDYLNCFEDGSNLDLVSSRCGNPRHYSKNHVIVRMRNCVRLCKWMRHPLPLEPDAAERLDMYLSLNCDIEFLTSDQI